MSKKNPKLPDYATPDPIEIIKEEAKQNRYDQVNEYGSSRWTGDADTGWENIVEFNPEMQELADKQMGVAMRGAERDPFAAMGNTPFGGIMGGLMKSVESRYGEDATHKEGTVGDADKKLSDAILGKQAKLTEEFHERRDKTPDERFDWSNAPESAWMNRRGQLDARKARDDRGGDLLNKKMSGKKDGKSQKAPKGVG